MNPELTSAFSAATVRVLLVEDDRDDYVLTRDLLREIGNNRFMLDWVDTYAAGLQRMASNEHDVYLVDYRLDGRNGLELMREAQTLRCTGPVILLTGQQDRAIDLEAMRAGAADYLVKGRIDASMLERVIRYALERRRTADALRRAHDELEQRVAERTAELSSANAVLTEQIAERKRAEEALRQADRRKDEFLAMLGHELRNPLAPICSALEIIKLADADEELLRTARDVMERQIWHMARLIDDLLEVSRIMRGKIQLRNGPVELNQIVEHGIEIVRPLITEQRHELSVRLPAKPISLLADATRLEQVVANLLNNAAKYTEPGGHIELTVERSGNDVEIRVRDSGVGLSPEMVPHIFDLFTQAERSLDRSQGGFGIGLALVRRFVEMHGGSVEARSEGLGFGSEFIVRLPVTIELPGSENGLAQPDAAVIASPGGRRRVLVVDDNVDAADSLALLLRHWNHEVLVAHDGPKALEAAIQERPDVVLLDIGLPGITGYEVAERLRKETGLHGMILIAMTGYGQEADRRRSQAAGFDQHLVKPVKPADLKALLANAGTG